MYVLEVETAIRVTLWGGEKRHKTTLLMLLNGIKKISTIGMTLKI